MKTINDIDLSQLSKKRRLVVQYALDNPDKVVLMRMEELSDLLGVNPATIVKACKAIGLNGFYELKELLKEEVLLTRVDSIFTGMIKEVRAHSNPQKVAQDAILGDIMMLQKTYDTIDFKTIEKIAMAIAIFSMVLKSMVSYVFWSIIISPSMASWATFCGFE